MWAVTMNKATHRLSKHVVKTSRSSADPKTRPTAAAGLHRMVRAAVRESWRYHAKAAATSSPPTPSMPVRSYIATCPEDDSLPPPGMPTIEEKASWNLEKWVTWATALVPANVSDRASSLARQQMAPHEPLMQRGEHTLAALAHGVLMPVEAPLQGAARMEQIYRRHLLLELGQALVTVGKIDASCRVLGSLAEYCENDPSELRVSASASAPEIARASQSRHFEREIFQHWALSVELLGKHEEGRVHALAVRRLLWASPLQRPLDHYQRELRRRPFWEASELPDALSLQAAFPQILAECNQLMRQRDLTFAKYHSRVVASGGWSDVQFFAGCKRDAAHCAQCPSTAKAIASAPRINSVIFGSHFFSRLTPGTHLSKHCGPSNFRLRCHLGLIVPPGVRIRVGTETREWRAGECLIFDDSFEHEVWHDGDSDRVVLICDLCTHACPNTTRACDDFLARPSSAASRLSTNHPLRVLAPVLNSGHPDVDIESMIYPLLSSAQRKAMDYAMAGRHETLQQRTYSTGASIARLGGD